MQRLARFSLFFLLTLPLLSLTACGAAQAPQASKARSRAVINAGAIVPASEIRVAEYLNAYDQHLPKPTTGLIGLDLRPGNSRMPAEGGTAWVQIGLQARSAQQDFVAPMNLALVIDRSGSMDAPDKMPALKAALRLFLESLAPEDLVALVVYSDEAEVIVPAQPVGDGAWIQDAITRIEPGGHTNIHAGLVAGIREVDRAFDRRRNNRVLLLTDGIANAGVTDPAQIAAVAREANARGIFLSTIGLGLEFNDALLIELADQGEGGYAFVDDATEMERIFREQVAGLKQRVASDVTLTLRPAEGVRLVGVTGMVGMPPLSEVMIPLWPLGTGDSAVLLAQMEVAPGRTVAPARPLLAVELRYVDEFAQQPATATAEVAVEMVAGMADYDPTWDLEILRNVTIQATAEGLREIDDLFQAGQYEAAWHLAGHLAAQVAEVARLTGDPQMAKDVALLDRYQQTLADALWQAEGRAPRAALPDSGPPRPYRGRLPAPPLPIPTIVVR